MIETEDILTVNLGGDSEVDGHDAGSGQMNIFIRTDNPITTFTKGQSLCAVNVRRGEGGKTLAFSYDLFIDSPFGVRVG